MAFPDPPESSRHPDTHSRVAPLFPLWDSTPCRTPFRARPDTSPILSDTLPIRPQNCPTAPRNPVRQESECCPTGIGTLSDRDYNHCPTETGIRSFASSAEIRPVLSDACGNCSAITFDATESENITF